MSETNYYAVVKNPDGHTFTVYAVDEHAQQNFFGWGSDRNRIEGAFYGTSASLSVPPGLKGRKPGVLPWKWKLGPEHAREMLGLVSQFGKDDKYYDAEARKRLPDLVRTMNFILGKEAPAKPARARKIGGHDSEILDGISRGVWADHWAMEKEEKGASFSGVDIMDAAPRTPAWAKKWGKKIADEIVEGNGGRSLEQLYELVAANGYPHDRSHFGYHLGMQAAEHGVSWSDDTKLPHDAIKIPRHQFYRAG
jgi:hypothetical protein